MSLSFKRALITGAGARVAQAISVFLAQKGYDIAVHYRSSDKGAELTAEKVRAEGCVAHLVQADLSKSDDLRALIVKTNKAFDGPFDVLINCASTFEDDDIHKLSDESWNFHFDVNAKAPIFLSQGFAAQLPKDKDGTIINIIDQRVKKLSPGFFSYTLSKSTLWTATTTMAQALAPNIRVNGVGPGPTLKNARQSEKDFEKQKEATLLGEGSPIEEIIEAVAYLIEAEAVTGQLLCVDGGQHLIWQTPDIVGIVE